MNGLRWWQWRQKRRTCVDYEAGRISANTFADRMGYPAPTRPADGYIEAVEMTDPFEFVPLQYTPPPPPDLPPYEGNPTMLHARPKPEPEPVWDVIEWKVGGSNLTEVEDFLRHDLPREHATQPGFRFTIMSDGPQLVVSPGCGIARTKDSRSGEMRYDVFASMDALRLHFDIIDDEEPQPGGLWPPRTSITISGTGLDGATLINPGIEAQVFGTTSNYREHAMANCQYGERGLAALLWGWNFHYLRTAEHVAKRIVLIGYRNDDVEDQTRYLTEMLRGHDLRDKDAAVAMADHLNHQGWDRASDPEPGDEVEVQSMDQFVNGEPGERITHEEYIARGGAVGKDRIRADNPDFPQVERAFSNRERNTISWEGENYYTIERAMEVIDNVDAMETARDEESEQPTKEDPRQPWAILADEEPRQPWAILADLHERVAALVIRRPWEAKTPRTAHCSVEYNAGLINALDIIAEAVHGHGGAVPRVPVPPEEEPVDEASDEPEGRTIDTPFGKVYIAPVRISLPDQKAIHASIIEGLGPFIAALRGEKPASDDGG